MNESAMSGASGDEVVEYLKAVVDGVEDLLEATAGATGERVSAARARAERTLSEAKARMAAVNTAVVDHAKDAARATDTYVHEHPWGAVGIAAGVGLLVGVLISRR